MNENLTPTNSRLAFHCRKLKPYHHIDKMYTRDGVVYIRYGKMYKILLITTLFDMIPDFDFGDDSPDEEHNESLQSSYY